MANPLSPTGCKVCGRDSCPRPKFDGAHRGIIQVAQLDDCEDHRQDWRALYFTVVGASGQPVDELAGNFERHELASMYLEASERHDAVRARIDEHAAEIVRLREERGALARASHEADADRAAIARLCLEWRERAERAEMALEEERKGADLLAEALGRLLREGWKKEPGVAIAAINAAGDALAAHRARRTT